MSDLKNAFENLPTSPRMPTLFIGHGNPMNAIEDNTCARSWKALGEELPTPTAILCVSAHWMTGGSTLVHIGPHPKTIHDRRLSGRAIRSAISGAGCPRCRESRHRDRPLHPFAS
jgi:hypothetical protein